MTRRRPPAGFTLLELLLVLLVLGILAGVAVRHVEGGTEPAAVTTLSSQLGALRRAVEVYRLEHGDELPDARIVLQLTGPTDGAGNPLGPDGLPTPHAPPAWRQETVLTTTGAGAAAPAAARARPAPRGPYLRRIPINVVNGSPAITVVEHLPLRATGQGGWIYVLSTGEIRADVPGRTGDGALYWLL